MSNNLDAILGTKPQSEEPANRFYQMMRGENLEFYFELRFRDGGRTAFSYDRISWFHYSPGGTMLDINSSGTLISIEGRGLDDFFAALKAKKISWVREADTEWQDNETNSVFIKEITIIPPKDEFE